MSLPRNFLVREVSALRKRKEKIVILGSIYLLKRFHEKNERKIEHVPIVVAMVTIAGKMCVCTRGGREKFVQLRRRES